ncbi:MAG: response regulator transcription factor [Saprospiraceae bacterium]|nr:response regulator transcription factor [Saprospiraceae bacterium]
MLRIGLIEDDQIVRLAYEKYFEVHPNFNLIYSFDNMEDFLEAAQNGSTLDIILSDIGLPGMNGISGIPLIKKIMPKVNIIMVTVFDDSDKIFKALCAGASGYLLKNMPIASVGNMLLRIGQGGAPMSPAIARKVIEYFHPKKSESLTAKESQIVQCLVDGLSYKMIADRLQISIHTVNSHIKNIYRKLHVNSKAEVIAKSLKGEI